jgi:hypothetical protein
MRVDNILRQGASVLWLRWRLLVGLIALGTTVYVALTISDAQGRADLPRGYAVRMTCEDDPESHLWSGECGRVAAAIARTDRPSFIELYRAFVAAHHTLIPSPALRRRFASLPCEPGFDVGKALQGTRFILEPERFERVCLPAYAEAIKDEIDEKDRALLTIERGGLSYEALLAGTLANLTEPLVILGGAALLLALWIL